MCATVRPRAWGKPAPTPVDLEVGGRVEKWTGHSIIKSELVTLTPLNRSSHVEASPLAAEKRQLPEEILLGLQPPAWGAEGRRRGRTT